MGNPHAVVVVDDVDRAPVETLGPLIENHVAFPNRTNVEFIERLTRDHWRQRTWERGVGETLACGSGACAVGVAVNLLGLGRSVGPRRTPRGRTRDRLGISGSTRDDDRARSGSFHRVGPLAAGLETGRIVMFQGVFTALVTPFREDRIDEPGASRARGIADRRRCRRTGSVRFDG